VWERYFPDQNRLRDLLEAKKSGETVKDLLMSELNVITNLCDKRRFMSYNLVGHSKKKKLTALDIKHGLVVSGSEDNTVKVWDLAKKRGLTFDKQRGHMSQIT
jgi:WD40 repeat protein